MKLTDGNAKRSAACGVLQEFVRRFKRYMQRVNYTFKYEAQTALFKETVRTAQ